ncbi:MULTISPECIES: MarR family winged helix-turn-helix transcriptional regulator [Actinosynnema]|uniref:MarR family winged helix-turn-helix transcriptional regulator n=1 Tax=Actinosynnema TaxID=40566 RepID=UPI0020A383B6|nr:MarR family transcriptional regulator [Actinosynnema pretiosum]MCP2092705.1 DNA-binding transcriptional regulator, MarR family [Actinosynnema pretiosum]
MAEPPAAEQPNWLSPEQLHDWKALAGVLVALPSALESQLRRDSGLSLFSYLVMAGLSEVPDRSMPMSELVAFTQGSASRLSHTVTQLERQGWVTRAPSPDNGRITLATLTDAGFTKLAEAAPAHVAEVRKLVVDVLGQDELGAMGAASRTLLDALLGVNGCPGQNTTAPQPHHP